MQRNELVLLIAAVVGVAACSGGSSGTTTTTSSTSSSSSSSSGGASQSGSSTAEAVDVGGNYTCTIEGVKTDVFCGGPVYRSDVSGSEQTWTITQTGSTVTIGAWDILLEGTVDRSGNLHVSRRDATCENNCSQFPFVIDVDARAGKRSLQDIRIHLYQDGNDEIDCEKTFQGTCAAR